MIDEFTGRRLVVSTDGASPYVVVVPDQVDEVGGLLDENRIRYQLTENAVQVEGRPAASMFDLGSGADPRDIQRVLDSVQRIFDVFVVRPANTGDYLRTDEVDQFAEVKGRTLGYTEASLHIPIGPNQVRHGNVPLGATKSEADAQRLVAALATELPQKQFVVEPRRYVEAEKIIWHEAE